jgi:hypothetical protein
MWKSQNSREDEPKRSPSVVHAIVCALPGIADDAVASLLIACAVWLAVQIAPRLAALHVDVEAMQAQAVATENGAFCDKWGVFAGSQNHVICMHDLEGIRAAEQARFVRPHAFD